MIKKLVQGTLGLFGYALRRTCSFNKDPLTLQRELVEKKEPVIFDVGAHVGVVTKQYRALFGDAFIHSFEPFPQSYDQLCRNLANDGRVTCHRVALAARKGRAMFNANAEPMTNSLLTADEKGHAYWGDGLLDARSQIEVETTTVDDFLAEHGIPYVDILKLDVQGSEFDVLTGASKTLKSQGISIIYTELITCQTYKGQHKFHEYLQLLDSLGYEMLDIFSPMVNHKQLLQVDVVFVSTAFKKQSKVLR